MKTIPVDQAGLTFIHLETVEKQKQHEQTKKMEQTYKLVDGRNVPQWSVRCTLLSDSEKPSIVEVTLALDNPPILGVFSQVEFDELAARPWAMGGNDGIAFSAQSVRELKANPPVVSVAPATANGTKAPEKANA